MPSIHAQYNEEIVQAHREALAALRELLAEETDPLERRRLAIAILRARPAKEPAPEKSDQQPAPRAADHSAHKAKNTGATDRSDRVPHAPGSAPGDNPSLAPSDARQPENAHQTTGSVLETADAS